MRNARKRSRAYDTFLAPSTDQSEWLVGPTESFHIVNIVCERLNLAKDAKILIPGVGLSELPRSLFDAGFTNLTLLDVEPGSITHQQMMFDDSDPKPSILQVDLLGENATEVVNGIYEMVLDKSMIDVFLRQGSWQKIRSFYEAKLQPDTGVLVCFSMFHQKWKTADVLPSTGWITMYASIRQTRHSRTRPSVVRSVEDIAIYVATRKDTVQEDDGIAARIIALEDAQHKTRKKRLSASRAPRRLHLVETTEASRVEDVQ